jgi:predicted nucleic acid-binding protein
LLDDATFWISARHTLVEVRRNLTRLVHGAQRVERLQLFALHWSEVAVIELNEAVCEQAAELAEATGVRTMDALHLGAAAEAGAAEGVPIVTFDRDLADAARSLGWRVLPA